MIRAFLAVELSEDFRNQIARIQQDLKTALTRELPRAVHLSWVRPASIHLTVKFLGDIDEQIIEPLREGLAEVFMDQRAISIPLERLGAFPSFQAPRVLWVGASERWEQGDDARRLVGLYEAVETCCDTLGFASDNRPLSPHLTLARIKAGEREFGQVLAASGVLDRLLSLGSLAVESVALMKSELKPTGSVYTKLWDAGLTRLNG
ncbi:MAG: RNA 2',3'-cyclic phosphodiesterase [Nitrospira sp.]|nr:MAG: RNA 2',3'-cyclic phosphodiesterase [Nitrospira sp.]